MSFRPFKNIDLDLKPRSVVALKRYYKVALIFFKASYFPSVTFDKAREGNLVLPSNLRRGLSRNIRAKRWKLPSNWDSHVLRSGWGGLIR